ncbi:MAG TPA: hypothetical protein VES40_11810 [Ilumatobacteraceae bacterium]|nr:hypothetical protein [Ilumatobacteraceae bacterium]
MIDDEFGGRLLLAFNAPERLPVHQLFNEWWSHVPAEVSEGYVSQLMADERFRTFIEDAWFAEPLDLLRLSEMADGSLGQAYHDWIVDNGLTAASPPTTASSTSRWNATASSMGCRSNSDLRFCAGAALGRASRGARQRRCTRRR